MKKVFPLLLIFFSCTKIFSQDDTTIKTTYVRQANLFFNNVKENHLKEDSTLDNHFNYINPDYNGNLGLPSQEIFLENKLQADLGFRYLTPNYRDHFYTGNDITYYNTKNPYTRAFVVAGQRQEQMMRLVHTQNIKRFNYMIKFNRYKCNGFYNQQTAINDNFNGTINYSTKSNRYKIFASLLYNKLRHKENGGIKYDTAFTTNDGFLLNKQLFDVNLQDAKRVTRNLTAEVMNVFRLNKSDSAKTDHFVYYSTGYSGDFFVYQDNHPKDGFYKNIYFDSLLTLDSTHISKFINQVGYSLALKGKIKTEFFSQLKNEMIQYKQFVVDSAVNGSPPTALRKIHFDSAINNTILSAGIHSKPGNADVTGRAEYVISGSNSGDYSFNFNYFQKLNWKRSNIRLGAFSENRTQDLFFRRYYGNHFQWVNDFDKRATTQFSGEVNTLNGFVKLENVTRITSNYIYFDSLLMPKIYSNNILVSRISLSGNLKFNKIHFNNKINYQFTNTKDIIRLPDYIAQSQLYYDGKLFKNNLHLQAGAQVTYYSSFKANAYMPATNQYYLQNSKSYGNYPFVDFFINAEIKPVRFFFKLDHINQGLSGANYLLTPNMPMPDRAFKFGFTWLFWD